MVIRNFLFHRVSDEADRMWPPMKVSLFRKIIAHLSHEYFIVPLEHYLDDPGAFPTKKKIASVLFDDGYKDNIEFAAPVLAEIKCPASFYVVTDCIDKNIPTWTYLIDNALANTRKKRIELSYDFAPAKFKSLELAPPNALIKEVKPWMKKLSNAERRLIIRSILEQTDDVEVKGKMMSWNDIRQLIAEGYTIGSHSHTHPMLASLTEEEISVELKISAQRIRQETGKFPLSISYPNGSFDERVLLLSKKEGYRYGLAVEQQFYRYDKNDMYKISRVELYQEPWWKVKMRVSGIYSRIKKLWP